VAGQTGSAGASESPEANGPQPGEVDPLVGNGLGSPLCRGVLGEGELARANRRNCETSGFVAAAAPTGDYGIDVHIDTGFLGFSRGGLLSIVQDLFVQPLWMAIVWVVHALIVMLEWGFTIDLLDSPGVRESVGAGLQRMQLAITVPWLALALASASILALYNGLIRRRVAETLAEALTLVAMVAGGMWVAIDPSGTVGAVGEWANQASLGTLATVARGAPARSGNALASSMSDVFAVAVEVPWCYLEFGDVAWCHDPARLDPELHLAANRIAGEELVSAGCHPGDSASGCSAGSARSRGLAHSARLLREARTNGSIFLALPANGPARNSINDTGSLLRVMCRSTEATACQGPMAAAAEFRTDGGTWPRVGGLLLIAAGLAGMLLMLGFIAARLLAAALFSLFYLLLLPAVVLAPAFGERGRQLFGRWVTQLFAAVLSKLLFSFLLGVMLAVAAILSGLRGLGFWTQWLLMSIFWWGAFARREHVLALAGPAPARNRLHLPLARRLRPSVHPPRRLLRRGHEVLKRLGGPAPTPEQRRRLAMVARAHGRTRASEQVARLLNTDRRAAQGIAGNDAATRARVASLNAQLERLRAARTRAAAGGGTRRAAELSHRAARVERELASARKGLDPSRLSATGPRSGDVGELRAREVFLSEQAALPPSRDARASPAGARRDYAELAGLLGYTPSEYDALAPAAQRATRLELDRELALRREISAAVGDVARGAEARALRGRPKRGAESAVDSALDRRLRAAGEKPPASALRSPIDRWRAGRAERSPGTTSSRVLEDARAVAERRKRQLGFGRD
jgi:hypothetical protein